jgi:hypothetical protein
MAAYDWPSYHSNSAVFGASPDPLSWALYAKPMWNTMSGYHYGKVVAGDNVEHVYYCPERATKPKWVAYVDAPGDPRAYVWGERAEWDTEPDTMSTATDLSCYLLSWHDPSGIRDSSFAPIHGIAIWDRLIGDRTAYQYHQLMTEWQAGL